MVKVKGPKNGGLLWCAICGRDVTYTTYHEENVRDYAIGSCGHTVVDVPIVNGQHKPHNLPYDELEKFDG